MQRARSSAQRIDKQGSDRHDEIHSNTRCMHHYRGWCDFGAKAGVQRSSKGNAQHNCRGGRRTPALLAPPTSNMSRTGMQITYRVAFTRIGEILGKPIITFESPDASDEERLRYRISVAEALTRCTPLPFTEALGNAIAGRPISIRLIDERGQRRI